METPDSYRACLRGLNEILPFAYAQYLIEDSDNHDYKVVASILPEGETGYDIAHRTGVIGQVFRIERPIAIPDVRNHPLYDAFDSEIEWELCFPLLRAGELKGVINLEGTGSLRQSPEAWFDIRECVLGATQYQVPPSPPRNDDSWRVCTSRVLVATNYDHDQRKSGLAVARALARDGNTTLLVGEYPSLVPQQSPNLDEVEEAGLSESFCCYGIEQRLDLLAAGPRSKESIATRTDWWKYCEGRYAFVVIESYE
jgi:hypothetical protein